MKAKKWWLVGFGIGLLVLIVIAVVLGIIFSKGQNSTDTEIPIINKFTCEQSPSECAGVPQAVNNYIFSNYNNSDEVRSLLQTSRSFNLVPTNNTNITRQNLTDVFRNISKSVQCMSLNLPDSYDDAFQKIS